MHPFGDLLEWYELETAQEAIMALNSAFSEQRSLAPFSKHLRASNSISVLSRRFIYILSRGTGVVVFLSNQY